MQNLLHFYELYKLVIVKHTAFINLINPRLKKFIIQTLQTTTTTTSKRWEYISELQLLQLEPSDRFAVLSPFGSEGGKEHYSWPWRKQILASGPKPQNFIQTLLRTKCRLKSFQESRLLPHGWLKKQSHRSLTARWLVRKSVTQILKFNIVAVRKQIGFFSLSVSTTSTNIRNAVHKYQLFKTAYSIWITANNLSKKVNKLFQDSLFWGGKIIWFLSLDLHGFSYHSQNNGMLNRCRAVLTGER